MTTKKTRKKPATGKLASMRPRDRKHASISRPREAGEEEARDKPVQIRLTHQERTEAFRMADKRARNLSGYLRCLVTLDKRGKVDWS